MIYLLYISWLFITQADDCFKGSFELNDLNNCELNCNDDDVKFVDKAEVTFTQILHSCYNVRRGYQLGDCTEVADLVWSDNCGCPFCACASKDVAGSAVVFETIMDKTCYNCTCNAHKYDTTIEGNVLDCDSTYSADSAYEWKDFECPANYCTDDDDDEVDINDYWWADVAVDAKCEKFCYCKFDGTSECQTGFSNIINHGSATLKAAFYDRCEWDVQACANTPTRMYSADQGPSCYSWDCPKCTCNGNSVGDIWWNEYESQDEGFGTYVDAKTCARCECHTDSLGVQYAECDDDDSYPINGDGTYTCPGSAVISCHSDDEWSDCAAGTCVPELKVKSDTINSREYRTNQPEAWCTNSQEIEIESNDDDDMWWDWGSDTGPFCAIWGTNEQCGWYSYSVTWQDCYGDSHTESRTTYEYCCNTANCNYIDINMDKNTCNENTAMSNLLKTLYECIYTGNGRSGFFGGDCETLEEEIVSCTSIKNLYEDQANCLCRAYKGLYDPADAQWKIWIKDQIDMFMTSFTEWNDVLNCPGRLEC
eukprot:10925_1